MFNTFDVCICRRVNPDEHSTGYQILRLDPSTSFVWALQSLPHRMPGLSLTLRFARPGPLDVLHAFKAFLIRSPLPVHLRRLTRSSLALHAFRVLPLTTGRPQLLVPASLAVSRWHCCPRCGFRGLLPAGSVPDLAIKNDPHGCSALQGFHLSRSSLLLPANSLLPVSTVLRSCLPA